MAGSWVAHQVNSRAFASTSCTDGSNVSPSATQSEVQRNPPGLLLKLREMGAIPHLLRSNRTGESVLLIAAGKLCSLFLRRASEQSGFNNSVRRMQCDHKPIMKIQDRNPVALFQNRQAGPSCFAVCSQFPQGSRYLRQLAPVALEWWPVC